MLHMIWLKPRLCAALQVAAILGVVVFDPTSAYSRPLEYQSTWSRPDGTRATIFFQGTIVEGSIRGTLQVGQGRFQIVADRKTKTSISGAVLNDAGARVADFTGLRGADGGIRGSFRPVGTSQSTSWEAPGLLFPQD
jgi:hypothetical protein